MSTARQHALVENLRILQLEAEQLGMRETVEAIRRAVAAVDPARDVTDTGKAALAIALTRLTDEQRLELFGRYCKACGCDDPGCQCWNDE